MWQALCNKMDLLVTCFTFLHFPNLHIENIIKENKNKKEIYTSK